MCLLFGNGIVDVRSLMRDRLNVQHSVYGNVRSTAAQVLGHDKVVSRMYSALESYVTPRLLGRVWAGIEIVLERREGIILKPDITFVVDGREAIVSDRVWGPPDMVLEVTSAIAHSGSLEERVAWYSLYGVREYWLVQPQQEDVTVLELAHGGVRRRTPFDDITPLRSPLLPDFNRCLGEFLT